MKATNPTNHLPGALPGRRTMATSFKRSDPWESPEQEERIGPSLMCRPVRLSPGRAAYACLLFLLAAAAAAFAEVPPVVTEDVRLQKWGEERTREVQEEGVLFYDADGVVYIGDGVTPGGKAVCVGRPTDLYSWTNDVAANGHALLWGGGWSQQAEGDSLLLRLGTNSWLRLVSASAGELANLFVSDLDQTNGTMRITADTTDPAATMLVATNLLDPEAWQTATNAQVIATTDASTTWLVTLLDTSFETYKVRVTTTREAGIHAERTFHANAGIKLPEGQGIEMDGERWDEWPNMANYASNSAVEAVAENLSAHTSATNPHGITAAGIGALTTETDSAALGALNIASNALHGEISGHATRTDNPHNITAQQIGALPLSGGTVTNNIILQKDVNDGTGTPFLIFQKGTSTDIKADWRLVVNNDKMYVQWRTTQDWVWNNPITFDTNSISAGSFIGRGDLLTVNSTNLNTLISELEARHERPETCRLYWPNEFVTNHMDTNDVIFVPTNFPTRKLDLSISDQGITNLYVRIPSDFQPERDVEITISVICDQNDSSTRNTTIGFDGIPSFLNIQARSQYRVSSFSYDSHFGTWIERSFTSPVRQYSRKDGSNLRLVFPDSLPATVEEWLEAVTNPPAQTLSMPSSPQLVPGGGLSSAIIQPDAAPLEDLDSLETLENLTPPEAE